MKKFRKRKIIGNIKWIIFVVIVSLLYIILEFLTYYPRTEITFSSFLDRIVAGTIREVNIKGTEVTGTLQNGKVFLTSLPQVYPQLIDDLRSNNIKINISSIDNNEGIISGFIFSWLPIIILMLIWLYYIRNAQGIGNQTMRFGKSRAKLMYKKDNRVTFNDVAGIRSSKNDLEEIVRFLKDPKKFSKLGAKIPRGCLLIGAPGTGKTLLAKAMAGEAQVPFFTISGSDFVEMFVGVGASRVRDMFVQAKKYTPCIIFIDEIDAVGRHRGVGYGGGNDEREQTLNQLLVEMDGFEENQGIIVIAATNRIDVIDNALLRAGRFDRQIYISMPNIIDREEIIKIHAKNFVVDENLNIRLIARATSGFSGADLANLVNEAALLAAKNGSELIRMNDFEKAKDTIIMGNEKILSCISEKEKKITAYHESGHAIVNFYCPCSEPIHKVTIIPRGESMGMLVQIPNKEKYYYSKNYFNTKICIALGGRAAEEIFLGRDNITTGSYNDIKVATFIAKNMVTKWGFNKNIGPVILEIENARRERAESSICISDSLMQEIDSNIINIVNNCYSNAKKIINSKKLMVHRLANILIRKGTITGYEIRALLSSK